jgi:type 1 glutamine amidotransferase
VIRRTFLFLLALAVAGATTAWAADEPKSEAKPAKKGARILMVTQSAGFKHGSVTRKDGKLSPAERALTDLGISSGVFRVDCTQDVAKDFTKEKLAGYDIVYFYTTGAKLPIDKETLEYFVNDWAKQKGHGFIGSHSATDTYNETPTYYDMIGGTFDGHPWGAGSEVTITVHDKNHPASKPWGDEFTIKDEIYKFKHFKPENVRVLMSMNMAKTKQKAPYHVPIAWVKQWGEGRVFYISLGHQEDVWTNEKYLKSVLGGIKWILREEDGDATPNPELSKQWDEKSKADAEKK